MDSRFLSTITSTSDRYNLYILPSSISKFTDSITFLQHHKINSVNIGIELATYIDNLPDFSYLNIDVFDYIFKLLNNHKVKLDNTNKEIVAIYNLGILLEPSLELNAAQLLKDFSKATALIIIWENQFDTPNRLHWSNQTNNVFLDFTETPLKSIQYAI